MKVSHIIYKVENLDEAVAQFRNQGFAVEYGKKKHPYNAIIYFSEGPYLELLANSGMPKFIKKILAFTGKKQFVNRLNHWDNHSKGPCGLALETYEDNLKMEKNILEQYQIPFFEILSRRNDTKGRKLRFTCLFPAPMEIPFFMTYFNIDPKPKNFIHPNGKKGIKSVSFGTTEEYLPMIEQLCQDPILHLFIGSGIANMEFESVQSLAD